MDRLELSGLSKHLCKLDDASQFQREVTMNVALTHIYPSVIKIDCSDARSSRTRCGVATGIINIQLAHENRPLALE